MCWPAERAAMHKQADPQTHVDPTRMLHLSTTQTAVCVFDFGAVRSSQQFRVAVEYNKLGNSGICCSGTLADLWWIVCRILRIPETENALHEDVVLCVCLSVSFVTNSYCDTAGGKEAEGVWEQGVEENIWT